MSTKIASRTHRAHLLLFASGIAGLGYEIVWTHALSVGLGHEIQAVLAVLAAFFCGSAAGAWALDGRIRASERPWLWYAGLELVIAAWSFAVIALAAHVPRVLAPVVGADPDPLRHGLGSFAVAALTLFPATAAMGATLPAVHRMIERAAEGASKTSRAVGGLYAANTLGAVAGLGATTFVLVPSLGQSTTSALLAAVNVACAFGAIAVFRTPAVADAPRPPARSSAVPRRVLPTLFLTGVLGIGYEVLAVRVLSQSLENTVYTFAAILTIFLVGTSLGAAAYQRRPPRGDFEAGLGALLPATATACLCGTLVMPWCARSFDALRSALGGNVAASIASELLVAVAVLLLPTALMGATFSHLAQEATTRGRRLGHAIAANTLGSAAAPLLVGVLLLPLVGSTLALVLVSLGYLLAVPPRPRLVARLALPAVPLLAILVVSDGSTHAPLHEGERLLSHREGVMATVSVIEGPRGGRHLEVDGRFQMGGTTSLFPDRREAHIPLLLHPEPRRALFLGLGAGVTFAAAAEHPDLVADGVELVPEVVEALPHFEQATGRLADEPRLVVHVADARRFVQAASTRYDVIVADLFHPARDGAGALYTVEHFRAVRSRLDGDGIFCQWLPLYQMDLATTRTIARSFVEVFPDASLHLAHYSVSAPIVGLVGGTSRHAYDARWTERRLDDARLREALRKVRLETTFELLGGRVAGPERLRAFAGDGPLNTDDHPVVTYEAPRFTYGAPDPASDRLVAILDALPPDATEALLAGTFRARLVDFQRARDAFVRTGARTRRPENVAAFVREVGEPLLQIVRTSGDFSAAYNPLLSMAARLHRVDPQGAHSLLDDLDAAHPLRPDARRLREALRAQRATPVSRR